MKKYFKNIPSGNFYEWKDYTPSGLDWELCQPQSEGKAAYIKQCRAELDAIFAVTPRVYCNITKVSASGMSRTMQFYVIAGDELRRITHLVAGGGQYTMTDDGLRVSGFGMDMRFAAIDGCCNTPANNIKIESI